MNIDTSLDELGQQHRELRAPADLANRVTLKTSRRTPKPHRHLGFWLAGVTTAGLALAIMLRPTSDARVVTPLMPGLSELSGALPDRPTGLPSFNRIRTVALPALPKKRDVDKPETETTGHLIVPAMENSA